MMLLLQVAVPTLAVGDRAPDVAFARPDGSPFRLSSLKGKIVVLEFTALACPPCRVIAPKLETLATKNPDVVFLTVCADKPEAIKQVEALRPKDAKTVFLQDPQQEDRSKMAIWQFGNPGFPSMYVIGRDGTMASRLIMDDDELSRLEFRIAWARKRPIGSARR